MCLRAGELTSRLSIDGRRHIAMMHSKTNGAWRTPMIDEHNLVPFSRSEGDAYKSSQTAELSLNASILRAEIAGSYEEFLDIFETFYADDVEVSSEDSRETIRGKASVRPFLLNFLVPLHVMAEVAGLSVSVQQTAVPRDTANETHSAWRIDFTGVGGSRCTLKWNAIRRARPT